VSIKKVSGLFIRLVLMFFLTAFNMPQQATQPSGYDVVAAVNAYRATKGYYPLNPHPQVMAAAQAHAEWIVATGQGGHIGASGSNETTRVSWTGYGGGASIKCDENWASGRTIEDALYGAWSDWTHQEVMLNAWGNRYTDAGGGVAALGNGRYVFILNVCLVVGKSSGGSVPGATANPQATADISNYIFGVTKATPMADGRIEHLVKYGQTLVTIAETYGTTIESLRTLNNMAADATLIYPEQKLLIQPATGIVAIQSTLAPLPTNTSQPGILLSAPTTAPTAFPIPTRLPTNPTPAIKDGNGQAVQNASLLLIGLAAIGLVVVLISLVIKP
jgi:uncharacterized protein YkwD